MPSHFKTKMELERVRTANAIVAEAVTKAYVPPMITWKDSVYFAISRCTDGPQGWKGLFRIIETDREKKTKKILIAGVDIHTALGYLETAVRRRVFK